MKRTFGLVLAALLVAPLFADDYAVVPIGSLSADKRQRALAFADGPLKRFSGTVYRTSRDFDAAIADIALAAGTAFHSPEIAEGFNRLGTLSSDMRLKNQEVDLVDAKDRLNHRLHAWGLHLVLNDEELRDGKINLSAYRIDREHRYDVLGSSFLMYEVSPLVEHEFYPALGHAETDEGYLLLFAQTIGQETAMTKRYLDDDRVSFLHADVLLETSTVRAIDALVRDATADVPDLRQRLIDTVGHHEGFHKHIEPTLADAVRRGDLTESEKAVWHETGAYLYQLESADAASALYDLMMILATSQAGAGGFYANTQGAREAIDRLEKEAGVRTVMDLFALPSGKIKKAAGDARQRYEVAARNGLR